MLGPVGKKARGRPRGRSHRYAGDETILEDMADAIVRGSATNPTQAARASGKTSDADIVRLRRQFIARRTSLLANAEKRRRQPAGRTIDRSGYATDGPEISYLEEISRNVSPFLTAFEREIEKMRPIYEEFAKHIPSHASGLARIQEEIDRHVNQALGPFNTGLIENRQKTSFETYLERGLERDRHLKKAFASRNPWDRF